MGKKETIQANPKNPYRWSVPELAKVCDLSESYIYRLDPGISPCFRDADGSIDGILKGIFTIPGC